MTDLITFPPQDGSGKVSRVIRIGTRKSQVQYMSGNAFGSHFIYIFND